MSKFKNGGPGLIPLNIDPKFKTLNILVSDITIKRAEDVINGIERLVTDNGSQGPHSKGYSDMDTAMETLQEYLEPYLLMGSLLAWSRGNREIELVDALKYLNMEDEEELGIILDMGLAEIYISAEAMEEIDLINILKSIL